MLDWVQINEYVPGLQDLVQEGCSIEGPEGQTESAPPPVMTHFNYCKLYVCLRLTYSVFLICF